MLICLVAAVRPASPIRQNVHTMIPPRYAIVLRNSPHDQASLYLGRGPLRKGRETLNEDRIVNSDGFLKIRPAPGDSFGKTGETRSASKRICPGALQPPTHRSFRLDSTRRPRPTQWDRL